MNFKANVKLHNKFEVFVRDIRSGQEKLVGTAYNMVLNTMWNQIIVDRRSPFDYICYGRGTGELAPTRTSLFRRMPGQFHPVRKSSSDSGYIKGRSSCRQYCRWRTNTMSASGAKTRLVTQLLRDAEGNPSCFNKDG